MADKRGEDFRPYIKMVEEYLDRAMPAAGRGKSSVINRAMRYGVFTGGKRVRPLITIFTGEMLGADTKALLPPACGIELIHNFSLIHDDLPSMDNDDFRRGKPTCHKKFGEDIAVLAGDAMLALAFGLIAESRSIELIKAAAEASGYGGMAGGQALDVLYKGKEMSRKTRNTVNEMKTGKLFQLSFRAPLYLLKVSSADSRRIMRISEIFGLAFQLRDDILDNEGERRIIEKDLREIYLELTGLLAEFGDRARSISLIVEKLYGSFVPSGESKGIGAD